MTENLDPTGAGPGDGQPSAAEVPEAQAAAAGSETAPEAGALAPDPETGAAAPEPAAAGVADPPLPPIPGPETAGPATDPFAKAPRAPRARWINPKRRLVTGAVAAGLVILGFVGGVGTGFAVSHGGHGERGGYGIVVRPDADGRPGGEYIGPGGQWMGPGMMGRHLRQGQTRPGSQQQNPQQQNPQQPQNNGAPSSTQAAPSTAGNG